MNYESIDREMINHFYSKCKKGMLEMDKFLLLIALKEERKVAKYLNQNNKFVQYWLEQLDIAEQYIISF